MAERITLSVAALIMAAIGLSPVIAMLASTVFVDGRFTLDAYETFAGTIGDFGPLMTSSVVLSLLTAGATTIIGVPLGILFAKTNLPCRTIFAVAFALPLPLPPYVFAVAWFDIIGSNGLLPSPLLSQALFGLSGCVWVLSTAFMPIVMLLAMAYSRAVNPRLEEAARLVSPWPTTLRRITLPLIAPAIAFAATLVFLLTLGEVGVPSFLRYPVYAREVLTQFAAFYDFKAATMAAMPFLVVVLLILAWQYRAQGRLLELGRSVSARTEAQIDLGGWRIPLFAAVSAWLLVTVLLPVTALGIEASAANAFAEAFARAGDSIARSIVLAMIGASLLTVLGFFCGYLLSRRTLPVWRGVDAVGLLCFTLPGAVIGIGLISLWNRPLTNLIYATPAIIVLGYLAQYAILPTRAMASMFELVPRSLENAARLSGASWLTTLRRIVAPLAQRGIVAAFVVSYVFCLRDLGVSMVIYPPGSDTLPVRILTLMANGSPSLIAALCVVLILSALLPLGLAAPWLVWNRKP